MIPNDYPELHNNFLSEGKSLDEDSVADVCPRCEKNSIIMGDDEQLFCRSCGYRESEGQK